MTSYHHRAAPGGYATSLACLMCGATFSVSRDRLLCDCGNPLEQQYDLDTLVQDGQGGRAIGHGPPGVWRYRSLLPLGPATVPTTLGEGGTPLVPLVELSARYGIRLLVKDESRNPTGSFKARGISVAASVLTGLGWRSFLVPTTGNGGSAWSAYAARAGARCEVVLVGASNPSALGHLEPPAYGAHVTRVHSFSPDTWDWSGVPKETAYVAGLREPYRLEGDKTMLFELVEQLGWRAPDVLVWPTGGAIALVGLAKAYEELLAIGTLTGDHPMMLVAAQHASAAPLADALRTGETSVVAGVAGGVAPGVQVGDPFAAEYVLKRVRSVGSVSGTSADDTTILNIMRRVARTEGLLLSPEGALAVAGVVTLAQEGTLPPAATVVCVNTASGLRYQHLLNPSPTLEQA